MADNNVIKRKKEIYDKVINILKEYDIPELYIDCFDDKYSNIRIKNNYTVPVGAVVALLIGSYRWFVNTSNPVNVIADMNGICNININYKR